MRELPEACIYSCVHFLPAKKPSEHASLLLLPAVMAHLGHKRVSNAKRSEILQTFQENRLNHFSRNLKYKKQKIVTHPIKRVSLSGPDAYSIALWQIKWRRDLWSQQDIAKRNLDGQSARPIPCTSRHLKTFHWQTCTIQNFDWNVPVQNIYRVSFFNSDPPKSASRKLKSDILIWISQRSSAKKI